MIISHEFEFIFIKTRKTAGTSIEVYLSDVCSQNDVVTPIFPAVESHVARNYQGIWNPYRNLCEPGKKQRLRTLRDLLAARKYYNHISATTLKNRISRGIWDRYYKFCVERNPWDKTLSHFHHRRALIGNSYTIDQYLDDGLLCKNFPAYADETGELMVDQVLRYEDLNIQLNELFQKLKVPFDGALTQRAKTESRNDRRSYQDVLTTAQRDRIAEIYSVELDMHGYEY